VVCHRRDPVGKAPRECLGVEQAEDPAEGVVRGDAVGQSEQRLEPVVLGVAVGLDRRPGFGARDDGTDGDADDVEQFVPPRALTARVEQVGEVVPQGDRFVVRRQAVLDVSTVGDRRRHHTWQSPPPASHQAALPHCT
jgi:hypothetical protein